MIENKLHTKKDNLNRSGISANKKKNTDDSDLLDVFEEKKPKSRKSAVKPSEEASTYKFGRPHTPEILSRSISRNPSKPKLDEPKRDNTAKPAQVASLIKKGPAKQSERSVSVSKPKNVEKEQAAVKPVTNLRQSLLVQSTQPKTTTGKSKSPGPAVSNLEKPKLFVEPASHPAVIEKPPSTSSTFHQPTIQKSPSTREILHHPLKHLQQQPLKNERSKSPTLTHNPPSKSQQKKYESNTAASYSTRHARPGKIDNKENVQPDKNSRQQQTGQEASRSREVKRQAGGGGTDYKPETMDLFQRLNEYTKFKESVTILNQPEPPKKKETIEIATSAVDQAKERAEHFLKKQIDNFSKKKPVPQASDLDLQKASQPRHKKQAVELKDQCSFQPLLAKKSMEIVDKMGYDKGHLYQSATPRKQYEDDDTSSQLFQPRICEKSKQIEENKRRVEVPRFEMLNRIGQEMSHKKRRMIKEKEREEEEELKAMTFKPRGRMMNDDSHLMQAADNDIVDRNMKWAQRRDEKLQRLKQDVEKTESDACTFKPKPAAKRPRESSADDQYYSSAFVKDGVQNYFTRLEQARILKKEKEQRLENWGRDRSKSKVKNHSAMKNPEAAKVTRFDNSAFEVNQAPQWETPGSRKMDYGSYKSRDEPSVEPRSSRQPGQHEVEKMMANLRNNLKQIQIQFN